MSPPRKILIIHLPALFEIKIITLLSEMLCFYENKTIDRTSCSYPETAI